MTWPPEHAVEAEALERGAQAFWGWFREPLIVEECEAVENAGVHPTDWRAAAECCIRAARGERDCRPFSTYPDLDAPPAVVPPVVAAEPVVPVRVLHELHARWTTGNHVVAPPDYEAGWLEASEAFTDDLAALLDVHEVSDDE